VIVVRQGLGEVTDSVHPCDTKNFEATLVFGKSEYP
jgi:hypothetical protein